MNQLQTSPTPPLPCKYVQTVCCTPYVPTQVSVHLWVVHDHCTLYSMPSLETEYCSHQYSILCSACRCLCVPPPHLQNAKHKPCASRSVGNYGRQLKISISSHVSQTEYQNPQKPANRTKLTLSLLQVVNEERANRNYHGGKRR